MAQLDNAFTLYGWNLDEVGISFAEKPVEGPAEMTSTEAVVVVEKSKLGICHWALKPLFSYAMQTFMELYDTLRRRETTLDKIHGDLISLSRAILLIKDSPLALVVRKELIKANYLTRVDEVNFSGLILSRHPKSSNLWQHRRWCLCRGQSSSFPPSIEQINECVLRIEINLCSSLSDVYPKNYFSWMHRLWLLQLMHKDQLHEENNFCKTWLLNHVSDHSASNHKIQVIVRLINLEGTNKFTILNIFENMLAESAYLIVHRPEHESLWCHRRTLLEMLFEALSKWKIIGFTEGVIDDIIACFSEYLTSFQDNCAENFDHEYYATRLFDYLRQCLRSNDDIYVTGNNFTMYWLRAEITFLLSSALNRGMWDGKEQEHFMQQYVRFSLSRCIKILYMDKLQSGEITNMCSELRSCEIVQNMKCDFGLINNDLSIVDTIPCIIKSYLYLVSQKFCERAVNSNLQVTNQTLRCKEI